MGGAGSTPIYDGLPPVEVHAYATKPDLRSRKLKHLLRANHLNHSVMYSRLRFHNHMPHILGSAYLLGADEDHLQTAYNVEHKILEPWVDAPHELTSENWREVLGDRRFQLAYLDFFEDEWVKNGYDWKKVAIDYMMKEPQPLLHGAACGLGHPLIHLGYAFELDSPEVAMEALTLSTTNWNYLHKYLDREPTPPPTTSTKDPSELLEQIRNDKRFDGLFDEPGVDNMCTLLEKQENGVLEYYRTLDMSDPVAAHRLLTRAATLLLTATHAPGHPSYDFFICHLLTTAYAVRILIPVLPAEAVMPLLHGHWLFFIVVYIIQLRPPVRRELVDKVNLKGRGWDEVVKHALRQKGAEDPHYLKSIRAMKESAKLWRDENEFYLKAATKISWEFEDWTGFGPENEDERNHSGRKRSL